MARTYKHSHLMSALKGTEEQIQDNYSSAQYTEVWDTLLYNALEPIVACTNLPDRILADILHFYVENHRRKLSSLPKELVMSSILRYLVATPDNKIRRLRQCRLERNVLRLIITTFQQETSLYQSLTLRKARLRPESSKLPKVQGDLDLIEARVGYNGSLDLFSVINTVNFWNGQANDFKNMLMEKYLRLIVSQAQTYYKSNNSNMELDDIIQNLIIFTSKALDKYDSRKGTLSSYIMTWLQHAKNVTVVQEDGIAFLLPVAKRSDCSNLAVSIDAAEVTEIEYECGENVEVESLRKRVQLLSKLADPMGLGRLALGISEVLTKDELALLRKHAAP